MDRLRIVRSVMTLVGAFAALAFIGDAAASESRAGQPIKQTAVPFALSTGVPTFFSIAQVVSRRNGISEPHSLQTKPGEGLRLASTASLKDDVTVPAPKHDPFSNRGYVQFGTTNAAVAAKWSTVQKEVTLDFAAVDRCGASLAECAPAARTLHNIVNEANALPPSERVGFVNRAVNRAIRYASDLSRQGLVDVWSSPLKVIDSFGDCEDYAIAKYALLRRLGTADDDIRILLVWDQQALEDHAVLAVRQHGAWQMLDNRYDEIVNDADAGHLRPIFALQDSAISLFAAPLADAADNDPVTPAAGWTGEPMREP